MDMSTLSTSAEWMASDDSRDLLLGGQELERLGDGEPVVA